MTLGRGLVYTIVTLFSEIAYTISDFELINAMSGRSNRREGSREKAPWLKALLAGYAAECIREQAGGKQYPRTVGTVTGPESDKTEWNRGTNAASVPEGARAVFRAAGSLRGSPDLQRIIDC